MATKSLCKIDGCDKPARATGMCRGHYMSVWRYGDPKRASRRNDLPKDAPCQVDGCGKKRHSGLYCSMHTARIRIHGHPDKGAFKPRAECIIDGCDGLQNGHGYCLKHYKRWKKTGSPHILKGPPKGVTKPWLDDVAVPFEGDGCLTFPFYRSKTGYGRVTMGGKNIGAHVYVLEQTQGPRPTPQHEVLHTCGNGHDGCVNPRHLRWGTRSENIKDAVEAGTFRSGINRRDKHYGSPPKAGLRFWAD